MAIKARIILVLSICVLTAWSAILVLVGLWLASTAFPLVPLYQNQPMAFRVGGVLLIAMGQYVFALLVADRLCPKADRFICGSIEALTAAVCIGCLGYLLVMFVMP